MTTKEAIQKTFGNDTARLREFLELTDGLFANAEAKAEAYEILAEMEAANA